MHPTTRLHTLANYAEISSFRVGFGGAECQVVTDANLLSQTGWTVTLAYLVDGPLKQKVADQSSYNIFALEAGSGRDVTRVHHVRSVRLSYRLASRVDAVCEATRGGA